MAENVKRPTPEIRLFHTPSLRLNNTPQIASLLPADTTDDGRIAYSYVVLDGTTLGFDDVFT